MKAWHFCKGWKLRDCRDLVVGKTYEHTGELKICASGLHASKELLDALEYAPGSVLCRVEISGDLQHQDDKMIGRKRKVLWAVDIEKQLHTFACDCAERALKRERKAGREPDARCWKAIEVKRKWINGKATDEELAAAWDAARDAARAAARAAARDAARDAAWAAARAAAWDAERKWQQKHLLRLVSRARKTQRG
ncbi:hypothetical protein LCGC14_0552420 [marine sediment metagenome]|uniref:DUF7666 domain-containing protein n=1 Tax=marine sediment metagenome TaxID=412755 RepID=A0A0F9RUL1_9ZZZZ